MRRPKKKIEKRPKGRRTEAEQETAVATLGGYRLELKHSTIDLKFWLDAATADKEKSLTSGRLQELLEQFWALHTESEKPGVIQAFYYRVWLGRLHVVVEGYLDKGVRHFLEEDDRRKEIDAILKERDPNGTFYTDRLRRCRHTVFHFPDEMDFLVDDYESFRSDRAAHDWAIRLCNALLLDE